MEYIKAKTIISAYAKNSSWFGNNYNMNIYKGCCHGCIYCDSRSECYGVENFDQVRAKENALLIIEKELKSKRRTGVVGTGAMSDPYNPFEKELKLTRGALELIRRYGFGLSITTKSSLILRDIDIIKEINKHQPVLINITVTTSDDSLCKKVEPNVAVSSERFETIKKLSENGIFTGILMMPILPFLEDNPENILGIVHKAKESGAKFIYPAFGVTLRQNQRQWYFDKLDSLFPSLKEKYIKRYGFSYSCTSPKAKELYYIFKSECDRLKIIYNMQQIIKSYKLGCDVSQLSIFDM